MPKGKKSVILIHKSANGKRTIKGEWGKITIASIGKAKEEQQSLKINIQQATVNYIKDNLQIEKKEEKKE